jgi:hypothetical protein
MRWQVALGSLRSADRRAAAERPLLADSCPRLVPGSMSMRWRAARGSLRRDGQRAPPDHWPAGFLVDSSLLLTLDPEAPG